MFGIDNTVILIALLVVLIFSGTHIAVGLIITSMVGIFLVTGNFQIVTALVAGTFYDAIREFIFAVLPLFLLMGEFISRSGVAADLYVGVNRALRRLPGRLRLRRPLRVL